MVICIRAKEKKLSTTAKVDQASRKEHISFKKKKKKEQLSIQRKKELCSNTKSAPYLKHVAA